MPLETRATTPAACDATGSLSRGAAEVVWKNASAQDERWLLAQRIARSNSLGRSRLLEAFLMYVVTRHIEERMHEITEQQIGVQVFGRRPGYDSNEDNIVRSYARTLRKRIDEYFDTPEGRLEPILLQVPRGGYVPLFSWRDVSSSLASVTSVEMPRPQMLPSWSEAAPSGVAPTPEELTSSSAKEERSRKTYLWLSITLFTGLLLGAVLARAGLRLPAQHAIPDNEPFSAVLWRQMFSGDRDTYVVPSDTGLVIMQSLTERPVPLATYVNGSYRDLDTAGSSERTELLKLGRRRYTSVVDLAFIARLAQLHEVVPARLNVRYARDMRMEDLRSGNAILIGSAESNPWLELFEPMMHFRFGIRPGAELRSGLWNADPRAGEQAVYGTPDDNHTFGLIAYLPNLNSTGHVLLVGGLNTAGTEAATNFLMTPALMRATLDHARRPDGSLRQFEILVGAGNVAASASSPSLVVERIGPH